MSEEFPKPLTDEVVRAADIVITMGCGDACPIYPGKRYEDWELDDPKARTSRPCARSATTSTGACRSWSASSCPRAAPLWGRRGARRERPQRGWLLGAFDRSQELVDHGREDVAVERVLVVELDGAVDLDHDPAAVAGRHEVDTDEVALDRSRGRNRDLARRLRWGRGLSLGSQGDIGSPFSLGSVSANGPDDLSAGDDEPEVVAERRDQLLHDDSLTAEPRARRELLERS